MTYAETFVTLTTEWKALDVVDDAISRVRSWFPQNQAIQLELDRQQQDANLRRAEVVEFVAISAILN